MASLVLVALVGLSVPPAASALPGWEEPRTLAVAGTAPYSAAIAENPAGDAVVVWLATPPYSPIGPLPPGPVSLYAAVRPRGGDWSAPVQLVAPTPISVLPRDPQASVGPHGDAVVVWASDGRVLFATRPAGGPWSAVAALSSPGVRTIGEPQLATNPEGRNIVVWSEPDGPRAAERAPGAAVFGPAERVPGEGLPLVGLDALGTATLAWTEPASDQPRTTEVRVAIRPRGGAWGTPKTVASEALVSLGRTLSRVDLERLSVSPTGTALLTWQRYGVGPAASRRDASGTWGTAGLSGASVQAGSDRDGNVYSLSLNALPYGLTSPWLDVVRPSGATRPIALPNPGAPIRQAGVLAVNGAGDAVAAWTTGSPDRRNVVIRSVVRARGAISPSAPNVARVKSLFARVQGVALDGHGDALVAWIEGQSLQVAERRRSPLTMAGLRVGRSRADAVLRFSLSGRAALRLAVARTGTEHLGGRTLNGRRGSNELRIAEPITGQPLRPGVYTVTIRAARGSERTSLRRARFTIRYGKDGRLASVVPVVPSAPRNPWLRSAPPSR